MVSGEKERNKSAPISTYLACYITQGPVGTWCSGSKIGSPTVPAVGRGKVDKKETEGNCLFPSPSPVAIKSRKKTKPINNDLTGIINSIV